MRKAILLLAMCGLADSLLAADPIVGTWKLNLAKSKFAPNQPDIPKSGTEAYREVEGDQIELTVTRTEADGSSVLSKYAWPDQGGAVKILQGGPKRITTLVETLIEQGFVLGSIRQKSNSAVLAGPGRTAPGVTCLQSARQCPSTIFRCGNRACCSAKADN
jgi:hypothetical protein